jgi:transposase
MRVPRAGKGRPAPAPTESWPTRDYPSRANRAWLRERGNVVERCCNRLEQWRGIAMRSDKLLRSYRAAVSLAATLFWIRSDLINTA